MVNMAVVVMVSNPVVQAIRLVSVLTEVNISRQSSLSDQANDVNRSVIRCV